LDSCWSLHLIYSDAGMTREQESKIRARVRLEQESEKRAIEREMRLLVGATLCGRPKKTIGKWQLIIKISSTLRGCPLTISIKKQVYR